MNETELNKEERITGPQRRTAPKDINASVSLHPFSSLFFSIFWTNG